MKYLFLVLIACSLFVSCADKKTFTDANGKQFTASPYGWANQDTRKIDGVKYEVNMGNMVLNVVFFETIAVPICLTGWQLYEPVTYTPVTNGATK